MSGDDNNSGGRSLGGNSNEPLPANWGSSQSGTRRVGRIGDWNNNTSSSGRSGGIRTLGELNSGGGGGSFPMGGGMRPPHNNDDDDDDEDGNGDDQGESWFAGGERSGISIQNPGRPAANPGGNIVRNLLRRAAAEGASGPVASGGVFGGSGNRLGSDEVASEYIPDPTANNAPVVRGTLTFWRDGFTVNDSELYRYDNQENREILQRINQGFAPPGMINNDEEVQIELSVAEKFGEDYPAPKRAFSGEGHRLGAPVPEAAGEGSSPMPGGFPAATTSPTSGSSAPDASTMKFEVDMSQPTTSVQIRLADGTRLVCRMNLTHTVLDLRNFINASRPENLTRPYIIGTTFPNRTLDDNTATIESSGLKNSVIVQRWV